MKIGANKSNIDVDVDLKAGDLWASKLEIELSSLKTVLL